MKRGTLVMSSESAHDVVEAIGSKANVQFEDMNAHEIATMRPYRKYSQRIEECERIVRFLFDEVSQLVSPDDIITGNHEDFLLATDKYSLDSVEKTLKNLYTDFKQFKENNSALIEARNATIEEKYVTEFGLSVFAEEGSSSTGVPRQTRNILSSQEMGMGQSSGGIFKQISGVIPAEDKDRFARFLFRSTRGNSFTNFHEIDEAMMDPTTHKYINKAVFVIYFQGSRSAVESAMEERIMRACKCFGVNTYPWVSSRQEAGARLVELERLTNEKNRALQAYVQFMSSETDRLTERAVGGNSLIEEWRLFLLKEKQIYHTMNMFYGTNTLRINVWFPEDEETHIINVLDNDKQPHMASNMLVTDRDDYRSAQHTSAPTYFKTNEFLLMPQELVFTYGIPRYREATPVLFTAVSFPFIFGVMFGDVGHGFLMLCFGIWLLVNQECVKNSGQTALYQARYLIFMMGFFATYAGFLYTDFFATGLDLFGSRWVCPHGESHGDSECTAAYDTTNQDPDSIGPYPFGIDPSWHGATNELVFMNSLKMKMSVILGVVQMTLGLLIRFSNAIYERNVIDFAFECIPMLIFMGTFFGFMDYMIVYKWTHALDAPPSIINNLINMAMFTADPASEMWPGFNGHIKTLMLMAGATVPVMLFPKPFFIWLKEKRKAGHVPLVDEDSGLDQSHKHDMSEICIHQVIETIEYVLGTVSHTASYLRLWALSLAHQQLAAVFLKMTLLGGMQKSFPANAFSIYFTFGAWFVVTCAILMGMDTMECFLHALRLHWVEFQSKFYRADGYLFRPFRHETNIAPEA